MPPRATAPSLHKRLLLAASIALVAFLGVTGWILDAAFRDSARTALRDRLQGHVYALLAAAELQPATGILRIPQSLPEARFSRPGSGLYAAVFGADYRWRSESVLGVELPWQQDLAPGEARFDGPIATEQGPVFRLSQGVAWEAPGGGAQPFTFNVIEDLAGYNAQVAGFRRTLWFWLGASALLLLALQFLILRWSLKPLRAITRELQAVEGGEQDQLEGNYPVELQGFQAHLNAFIQAERKHLARYRNTLADLAHSLKTPLAVLRGALEQGRVENAERQRMLNEVKRMDDIVAWRLKRAARAGGRSLGVRTRILPVAEQLLQALGKVYADRGLQCECGVAEYLHFPGEEGDLYELLGSLLDNAFKAADGRVRLRARAVTGGSRAGLEITVEDDGPGIAPGRVPELLRRGVRGDERAPGQGLGLAMVDEIVRAYDGSLHIERSEWGGARVSVQLPVRRAGP